MWSKMLALAFLALGTDALSSHSECIGGMKHTTKYEANVGHAKFVDLDGELGSKLGMWCTAQD